jgi:hypothetical protein
MCEVVSSRALAGVAGSDEHLSSLLLIGPRFRPTLRIDRLLPGRSGRADDRDRKAHAYLLVGNARGVPPPVDHTCAFLRDSNVSTY